MYDRTRDRWKRSERKGKREWTAWARVYLQRPRARACNPRDAKDTSAGSDGVSRMQWHGAVEDGITRARTLAAGPYGRPPPRAPRRACERHRPLLAIAIPWKPPGPPRPRQKRVGVAGQLLRGSAICGRVPGAIHRISIELLIKQDAKAKAN